MRDLADEETHDSLTATRNVLGGVEAVEIHPVGNLKNLSSRNTTRSELIRHKLRRHEQDVCQVNLTANSPYSLGRKEFSVMPAHARQVEQQPVLFVRVTVDNMQDLEGLAHVRTCEGTFGGAIDREGD